MNSPTLPSGKKKKESRIILWITMCDCIFLAHIYIYIYTIYKELQLHYFPKSFSPNWSPFNWIFSFVFWTTKLFSETLVLCCNSTFLWNTYFGPRGYIRCFQIYSKFSSVERQTPYWQTADTNWVLRYKGFLVFFWVLTWRAVLGFAPSDWKLRVAVILKKKSRCRNMN